MKASAADQMRSVENALKSALKPIDRRNREPVRVDIPVVDEEVNSRVGPHETSDPADYNPTYKKEVVNTDYDWEMPGRPSKKRYSGVEDLDPIFARKGVEMDGFGDDELDSELAPSFEKKSFSGSGGFGSDSPWDYEPVAFKKMKPEAGTYIG